MLIKAVICEIVLWLVWVIEEAWAEGRVALSEVVLDGVATINKGLDHVLRIGGGDV